jgi:hypothetical protein
MTHAITNTIDKARINPAPLGRLIIAKVSRLLSAPPVKTHPYVPPTLDDAAPAGRLRLLHVRGVAAAREVDVGLAPLVVVVEARNVGPHAVHRRELEGRRRSRQPDRHRRHLIAAPAEQRARNGTRPRANRVLEDRAREPVDLHDQQTATAWHRRRPQPEPAYQTIERTLQAKDEVVERHGSLIVVSVRR